MGLISGHSKENPRKIERGKNSILFVHQDYLLWLTNMNHMTFTSSIFRRRKNRRRNGKNRKIGPTGTDIDEYGPRNNLNDYNGDDSSSSFHRDTSDKFQLNSGMCYDWRVYHLDTNIAHIPINMFHQKSIYFFSRIRSPSSKFLPVPHHDISMEVLLSFRMISTTSRSSWSSK